MNGATTIRSPSWPNTSSGSIDGSGGSALIDIEPSLGSAVRVKNRRGHDQQPPVLPPDREGAEEQQHAVRRQDVADVEQHGVEDAEDHEDQRAAPQQEAGLPDRPRSAGPTMCATPYPNSSPNIGNARPSTKVAIAHVTTLSSVEPVQREAAEHRRALQEVVRVRQRDEQQHEAARQVGTQRALPQGGGSDGRHAHGPSPPNGAPSRSGRWSTARRLSSALDPVRRRGRPAVPGPRTGPSGRPGRAPRTPTCAARLRRRRG